MSDAEPWNNTLVRDGETEELLRLLAERSLTDDEIRRLCIREVDRFLSPAEKEQLKAEVVGGMLDYFLTLGRSPALGNTLGGAQERADRIRRSVRWTAVSAEEQHLSQRRAETLLTYAAANGWIERAGHDWSLTPAGEAFLRAGGFNMR
jgi:hypothetical protein